MPKRTSDYRAKLLEDLADPKEAAAYLNAARTDSPEMLLTAMRDVAEAHQMAKVAATAGVSRESLYRMLTADGNPTYRNFVGILGAMGLDFTLGPTGSESGEPEPKTPLKRLQMSGTGRKKRSRRRFGHNVTPIDSIPLQAGWGAKGSFISNQPLGNTFPKRSVGLNAKTCGIGLSGGGNYIQRFRIAN
jgi:probable addiction module antidote protein